MNQVLCFMLGMGRSDVMQWWRALLILSQTTELSNNRFLSIQLLLIPTPSICWTTTRCYALDWVQNEIQCSPLSREDTDQNITIYAIIYMLKYIRSHQRTQNTTNFNFIPNMCQGPWSVLWTFADSGGLQSPFLFHQQPGKFWGIMFCFL